MLNTVNNHGRLRLQMTCDGCGKELGEPEKYLRDLSVRAMNAGWIEEGYDVDEMPELYIACHYCSKECRHLWEMKHLNAKRRLV